MSQAQVRRRARSGWSEQETTLLWDAVREAESAGRPLKEVFEKVAGSTGRQPNSIRNYYYTVVKAQGEGAWRTLTVVPFKEQETRKLVKDILAAVAGGESVRACVQRMAGQDRSLMLRYQNKYRAVLKSRPAIIHEVVDELRAEGVKAVDPYERIEGRKRKREETDPLAVSFAALGAEAAPLVRGLRKLLSQVADRADTVRALQEENDRLKVQIDLLRMDIAKRDAKAK